MQISRPVKRLSDGKLVELSTQLINLLNRCWIQHSTAGHAAAVVFARKPDGSWRICYDYRGLNAITRPEVELLQQTDRQLASMISQYRQASCFGEMASPTPCWTYTCFPCAVFQMLLFLSLLNSLIPTPAHIPYLLHTLCSLSHSGNSSLCPLTHKRLFSS
jgi:hypothetical protein